VPGVGDELSTESTFISMREPSTCTRQSPELICAKAANAAAVPEKRPDSKPLTLPPIQSGVENRHSEAKRRAPTVTAKDPNLISRGFEQASTKWRESSSHIERNG